MRPVLRRSLRNRVLVGAAAMVVLAGGCGWQDPLMSSQRSATTVFPTTPTVAGSDLVRLWSAHWMPCPHPIGIRDRPADPHRLLAGGMWPSAADIASRLRSVTATGNREFLLDRFRVLGAVVLQTQTEMAAQVATATRQLDAGSTDPVTDNVVREQTTQGIKLDHDSYVAAVDHVMGELGFGAALPSAKIGHKYRLDLVCPDG